MPKKQKNERPLMLDARLISEMRKRKGPYETWNGCVARMFGITKEDLGMTETEDLRWMNMERARRASEKG